MTDRTILGAHRCQIIPGKEKKHTHTHTQVEFDSTSKQPACEALQVGVAGGMPGSHEPPGSARARKRPLLEPKKEKPRIRREPGPKVAADF